MYEIQREIEKERDVGKETWPCWKYPSMYCLLWYSSIVLNYDIRHAFLHLNFAIDMLNKQLLWHVFLYACGLINTYRKLFSTHSRKITQSFIFRLFSKSHSLVHSLGYSVQIAYWLCLNLVYLLPTIYIVLHTRS